MKREHLRRVPFDRLYLIPAGVSMAALLLFTLILPSFLEATEYRAYGNGVAGEIQPQATIFTVTTIEDNGDGSLRKAIEDANANPGKDTIQFRISGSGVKTIRPLTGLPEITDPLIIDGYTQPGAVPNPLTGCCSMGLFLIEISGDLLIPGKSGLTISAGDSIVRGLVIKNFKGIPQDNSFVGGAGILITGRGGNTVEGNLLGTDSTGTSAAGNAYGILILGVNGNTIGGLTPQARNIVSGNDGSGIRVEDGLENKVQGNYIGLDGFGLDELANGGNGVFLIRSNMSTIGGSLTARNIISGNDGHGISISRAERSTIQGNLVGIDATGKNPLGNGGDGIFIDGSLNTIGARLNPDNTISGEGNSISFNEGNGITLLIQAENFGQVNFGNSYFSNLISSNGRESIGYSGSFSCPNQSEGCFCLGFSCDPKDIIFEIVGVDISGNQSTVKGKITSRLQTPVALLFPIFIQLFGNSSCQSSSNTRIEQQVIGVPILLERDRISMDGSFTIILPFQPLSGYVNALATEVFTGTTTGFSTCSEVSPPVPRITGTPTRSGKKLIVQGERFDSGAVILINSQPQKTQNDPQNPTAVLVGKKAGKKVKPGDKVQVRNATGVLSNEIVR